MNTLETIFSRPIVESLGWTLVYFLWQGAAAAVLLAGALVVMRRASANARYVVACVALFLMAVCPVVTFWKLYPAEATSPIVSQISLPPLSVGEKVEVRGSDESPIGPPLAPAASPVAAETSLEPPPVTVSEKSAPQRTKLIERGLPWLVAACLVGVVALSIRLLAGWLHLRRIRRRESRTAGAGWQQAFARLADQLRVSRPVRLLETAMVEVPMVVGWLRPVILLPASALMGLTSQQLEALLAHELAHIRRYDYLVNLIQTVIETLPFYHPAIWWASHRIRSEREECCDEFAARICGGPLVYARALATMEELRAPLPEFALAASGGPLLRRIRRLLGRPDTVDNRSGWWLVGLIVATVVVSLAVQFRLTARAESDLAEARRVRETHRSGEEDESVRSTHPTDWGKPSGGLQTGVRAVRVTSSEEMPAEAEVADRFDRPDDITFVAELKNVSDQPINLLGVRYGANVATPWPGKSKSDWFAPLLFDCEFFDDNGRPVDRAVRKMLAADAALATDSKLETLEPGKTLSVLIRPAQWSHCMEHRLAPGTYRVRVHYRGPNPEVAEQLRRMWPDKPAALAWSGDVVSGEAMFTIADDPARKRPEFVWGEPKDGLVAALEFVPTIRSPRPAQRGEGPGVRGLEADPFPHGTKFNVRVHVKNVGDRVVQFRSEAWRQGDKCTVRDEGGVEQQLGGSWYTGWTNMIHWTLKPGQVAALTLPDFGIAADAESAQKFAHPIGPVLVAKPGKYSVRFELRFDSIQRKDKDGNVIVPGKDDWQGTITTGQTPLVVRMATPEDKERLDPTFTGLIEFVGPDGKSVERGDAEVWAPSRNRRTTIAIKPGQLDVPDCPPQPVNVYVRAPGFEEQRFYDVTLRPDADYTVVEGDTLPSIAAKFLGSRKRWSEIYQLNREKLPEAKELRVGLRLRLPPMRLTLQPAQPARFRLMSSVGSKLVDGINVRFFNRSKLLASAGPFPTDGTSGPVWATSDTDGVVVLDTLQKIDPHDAKLGPNIYWFYIEPPPDRRVAGQTVAPRFIGPIQAGDDLGDIALGPLLEARGEIRGTPEELDNLAGEWDQPEFMKGGPNDKGWDYAVSQTLEPKRDGDRLIFHLTGLRPGRLRIISNFAPGTKSVSHTHGRRDPGEDDIVFETELKESVRDIMIRADSRVTQLTPGQNDDDRGAWNQPPKP